MSARELGDFQTPLPLVRKVLSVLTPSISHSARVLEPTCGSGNFIRGLIEYKQPPREIVGIEIQEAYITKALSISSSKNLGLQFLKRDIFEINLARDIPWQTEGPLLVVGNPPWVTNATIGVLNGRNLPNKSNFKKLRGIDAITGASNFDIAEYVWIKLIMELAQQGPTISLLCKTSVARNVLRYSREAGLPITGATIRRLDAKRWFGVAVDACLFTVEVKKGTAAYTVNIFNGLDEVVAERQIGFVGDFLIPNIDTYRKYEYIEGSRGWIWRQGLKHDAASVMELTQKDGEWLNKLGERVCVEDEYVYPLLKGSDIASNAPFASKRGVIVTQKSIGEDTKWLRIKAPRLWKYLTSYVDRFADRKSAIYRKKPPFSVFGIGPYSFASYKVVVSGLYKRPCFVLIGPWGGKPVMCDDTCYFLSFNSPLQAAVTAAILNHTSTQQFLESVMFLDVKRPVTKALLSRIDIESAARRIPEDILRHETERFVSGLSNEKTQLPISLDQILVDCKKAHEVTSDDVQMTMAF